MSEKKLLLSDKWQIHQSALYGSYKQNSKNDKEAQEGPIDLLQATIGNSGLWQYKIAVLMSLLRLPINWFEFSIIFLAPATEFWCNPPSLKNSHWSKIDKEEFLGNLTIESNACFIADPNQTLIECDWGYKYNHSVIHKSIITDWNLVCEREGLIQAAQMILMLGVLLGSVIFGTASDKFGRRKMIMVSIGMQFLAGVLSSFSPWLWLFLFLRFMSGVADGGITVTSFVMCMEAFGGSHRALIAILCHLPLGFGNISMAGLAYYLRNWRHLQFIFSALTGSFLLYFYFLPESPRWLLSVGRQTEALRILEDAASTNGIDKATFHQLVQETKCPIQDSIEESYGLYDLVKTRQIRKRSLIMWWNWLLFGAIFYGFTQYIGSFSKDIYVAVAVSGLATIPGFLLSAVLALKCGRRLVIALSSLFTAICLILLIVVDNFIFTNILIACIFLGSSVTLPILPLFTGELYPTVMRNAGIGSAAMCKKLGAVIAPMLLTLNKTVWYLPLLIFAVLSITSVLLILPLPETSDKNLPESISDIEE